MRHEARAGLRLGDPLDIRKNKALLVAVVANLVLAGIEAWALVSRLMATGAGTFMY